MTNEEILEKILHKRIFDYLFTGSMKLTDKEIYATMDAAREDEAGKWESKLKSERERSAKLLEALEAAVEVIKQWHRADDVWGIYFNRAPEMKPIRDAITEYKNNQ